MKTPYYVVEEALLRKNLEILKEVATQAGCKILLAQKAFSMYSFYPMVGEYLSGATASSLFEAKLAHEEMKKENHIFSPAYKEDEIDEILEICDHLVFNSFSQWEKYKEKAKRANRSCGLRINPRYSTQDHAIYDPCAPFSRFGVTLEQMDEKRIDGLEGIHFHTLCEQGVEPLEETLKVIERDFAKYLSMVKWVNFGGGHHITKEGYDRKRLISLIKEFKEKYQVEVYLEPGEAVALDTGFLETTVLDIVENGMSIAILDTSAACHMPDVIEMPYRPPVLNSGMPQEKKYTYRFGGPTCLTGDIIGDYSFDEPLQIGDRITFADMAIYSMVKNNTFNGMNLPSIAMKKEDGNLQLVKEFGYADFKMRLS